MDAADRAQAVQQMEIDAALSRRAGPAPTAGGACLFCEEPLADAERYCDQHCRDDYVRLQAKRDNDRMMRGVS